MPSSKAWAVLSILFMIVAGVNLALMGYYLGLSPDIVLRSLGRFLMALAGTILCGIMFQIMLTHERQKEITAAVNAVLNKTGGKKP